MTTPLRHVAPLVTPPLCKSGGAFRAIALPPWVRGEWLKAEGELLYKSLPLQLYVNNFFILVILLVKIVADVNDFTAILELLCLGCHVAALEADDAVRQGVELLIGDILAANLY